MLKLLIVSATAASAIAAFLIIRSNTRASEAKLGEFPSSRDRREDTIGRLPVNIHPENIRQDEGVPRDEEPPKPDESMKKLEGIYDEILARYKSNLKTMENVSDATLAFEKALQNLDRRASQIALSRWNHIVKEHGNTGKACELGFALLRTIAVLGGKESLLAIKVVCEGPNVSAERKDKLFWAMERYGGHLDDSDFVEYLLEVASKGCNADLIPYSGVYAIIGRHGDRAIADRIANLYLSTSGEIQEGLGGTLNLLLIRHGFLNVEKDLWWSYRERVPNRHEKLQAWLKENREKLSQPRSPETPPTKVSPAPSPSAPPPSPPKAP